MTRHDERSLPVRPAASGDHRSRLRVVSVVVALALGLVADRLLSNRVELGARSTVAAPAAPTAPVLPNLVIVTLDTTRADRLGSYGGPVETPALDAIATRGTRFAHAWASAPITLPSHASLFTGLDPVRHGVRENGTYVLAEGQHTLAEILREQGWKTAAFVGGFPLSRRFGLAQGFDHYDDALHEDNPGPPRKDLWQGVARPYLDRPAGPVVRRTLGWLEENAHEPFFVWVHLFDAHHVYEPPEPFATRYRGRLYDGEIAYMDSVLADLFGWLADRGLEDDTLVVIAADHGESLGEHGLEGHGRALYEPSLHVPLLVAFPGRVAAGRVVTESVDNVDVLPTVLDLLAIEIPEDLDGRNLATALRGEPIEASEGYAETLLPRLRFGGPERYSFRRGNWKLLREIAPDGSRSERLFDLVGDPGERHDRAAALPAVRDALAAALDRRMSASATLGQASGPAELDPETESALRALGCLE